MVFDGFKAFAADDMFDAAGVLDGGFASTPSRISQADRSSWPFAALQAVAVNPANHVGIAGRVGSLEVGKDADIVITGGCPFEVATNVK